MVFSVVFQANTGKKLRGKKIREEIMGPVNLVLNIPLMSLMENLKIKREDKTF